jgi:uncharacterized metal-binding protein
LVVEKFVKVLVENAAQGVRHNTLKYVIYLSVESKVIERQQEERKRGLLSAPPFLRTLLSIEYICTVLLIAYSQILASTSISSPTASPKYLETLAPPPIHLVS